MKKLLPGVMLSILIALIALFLGSKIHLMSASVIALLIGMGIKLCFKNLQSCDAGLQFTSKKLLKLGIILLGTGLSIGQILHVGKFSVIVMVFTLAAAFGFGYLFGKLFGMDWHLSSLISAGTGICGGSAVAALSPVIDADDSHVAYAISATFIFDIIMVILFPIMGRALGLSDMAYGLWAGTAVNDTSSVVAAGFAFSNAAGDFATIVKLTRTLSIIPIIIIFSIINNHIKQKSLTVATGATKPSFMAMLKTIDFKSIFPWFIIFFIVAAILNSIGIIPTALSSSLSELSKFLMVMALAAIGLKTDFSKLKQSGFLPMVHGFIISTIVVVVALVVQIFLGQV
ncbi:MAG: putative sulfate exporter family transporter [Cellulosilyticaceae bacterium]